MKISRSVGVAAAVASVAAVGLAGCSSNSDPEPSDSPTNSASSASASPTQTSSSPTASPTSTSNLTKFSLTGGNVKVKGAGKWVANGGEMTFKPAGSSPTAGTIEAFGKGNADTGDFNLVLQVDTNGKVTSGSFTAPNRDYRVTAKSGTVNFLSTGSSTTLTTNAAIPVQMGSETPTTMTINLKGKR